MTGILMTQVSTPIIGQAAWLLGKIMDGIYRVMDLIGIHNLGVCIILLTIVIYTLLMPLTIKQQKFSKMSAAMNPELQKVQQKYKGKNDQASMQKMQEETQLVYEKYGVSPTGGCLSMFIQFPILWAMYYVIRNIPAYVGQVKAVYTPLLTSIMAQDGWQKGMEKIGEAKPILMSASKYDYSDKNVLIDVLYKFQTSTWETLGKKLPDLQPTIDSTVDTLKSMNNFLGLNIAETPMNLISNGVKAGAWGIVIMAVLIPVLSGLSQYLSVKLSQQTTAVTNNPQADQMASTMKTMNVTLPLVSVFMCFTLPTGLGIYWVASAVVRMVQQFFINKHLNKIPMDELIKEFDYHRISKSPAVFDYTKLKWMNGEYIKAMDFDAFYEKAEPYLKKVITKDLDLKKIAAMVKTRIEVFPDIAEHVDFFETLPEYDIAMYTHKKMKTNAETSLAVLKDVLPMLEAQDDFSNDALYALLLKYVEEKGGKNGYVMWPIRTAVSGKQMTPGGATELMEVLGKEESITRIRKGIELLEAAL